MHNECNSLTSQYKITLDRLNIRVKILNNFGRSVFETSANFIAGNTVLYIYIYIKKKFLYIYIYIYI